MICGGLGLAGYGSRKVGPAKGRGCLSPDGVPLARECIIRGGLYRYLQGVG